MKVAIRQDELYINYAERFDDITITAPPYNYSLVEIESEHTDIIYDDFNITNGNYCFDSTMYQARIEREMRTAYSAQIEEKIREKYTLSDELSILRQRDTKPQEFATYNQYVEDIKLEVKTIMNIQ